MRKLLAIMFLMIFSLQVLPVKVIGKMLSKGQTEEEVKHSCDGDEDASTAFKFVDMIDHTYHSFVPATVRNISKQAIWRYADDLPMPHVADIPSPPPNC